MAKPLYQRIALIAQQMISHEQCGLQQACLDAEGEALLEAFETLLSDYAGTTREQWAGLKEICLLLLGSHIASSIDHLISGLRTPAIAESAIRSTGFALIAANEAKSKQSSQEFMRFIRWRGHANAASSSNTTFSYRTGRKTVTAPAPNELDLQVKKRRSSRIQGVMRLL